MRIFTKTIHRITLTVAVFCLSSLGAIAQFPFNIGSAANSSEGNGITKDASNNVYVTGCFKGTITFIGTGGAHINVTSVGFQDIYVAKYNSSGICQWAFDIGSGSGDIDNGMSIAADVSGNVYVTGYFAGTADFDPSGGKANLTANGSQDIFVAKYNSAGAYQWAFNMGSALPNTQFPADGVEGNGITVDAAGNVLVTGEFVGTANFSGTSVGPDSLKATGANASDMFVAKYNSAGAYQWAFSLGDATITYGLGIATDVNNNVLVTGIFTRTCDFKGTSGSSNSITVIGGTGAQDVFVAKYNSAGVNQWAFNIGVAGADFDQYSSFQYNSYYEAGIAADASGNVLVTGNFSGSPDFKGTSAGPDILAAIGNSDIFVAKYNSAGNYKWAFNIGSANNTDAGAGIATDASGDVMVTGGFQGTTDFKGTSAGSNTLTALGTTDICMAKYDSTGAYQCAFNVGSAGNADNGNAIVSDIGNNMLVTGSFAGTANFDPLGVAANLTSVGYLDAFVSKYGNCTICTADAGPNQTICVGLNSSATIGAAPVSGHTYHWSPVTGLSSSTVSQPTASPTVTTTYTLTESTTGNGCQATATVIVFVGIQPSTPVISASGPTTFCSGDSVTLNAGAGYVNYLWSNEATTQSINVIKNGGYSVTVSSISICSAVSSVTTVTVNPSPAAKTGPNKAICPGAEVVIGGATVNGDTYNWLPATGLSADTVSQPTANPTVSTWYKLTETITATGCIKTDSVLVNVNSAPQPVIIPSGPLSFCTEGSVTLNAGSGYSKYVWSNGASTQSIKVSTQGSYSVTVTNSSGCSAASAATNVTVTAPVSPAINQKGDTLFCSLTASSYQWYLNDTLISGANKQFYLPSKDGNYTIAVVEDGCSSTSSLFNYTGAGINPVAVANDLVIIYPTLASAYFIAESKTTFLQSVALYDILGKKILSTDIKDEGNKKVRVNIEALPAGVYFVQLKTNNAVSTLRLVKQ